MLTGICYKTMLTSFYTHTRAKKGNDEHERNSRFPWNLANFVLEFRSLPATPGAGEGQSSRGSGRNIFLPEMSRRSLQASDSCFQVTFTFSRFFFSREILYRILESSADKKRHLTYRLHAEILRKIIT